MNLSKQLIALTLALAASFSHAICTGTNSPAGCDDAKNNAGAKAQASGGKADANTETVVDNSGSGKTTLALSKDVGGKQAAKIPDHLPKHCFRGARADSKNLLSGLVRDKAETTVQIDVVCREAFDNIKIQTISCGNANNALDLAKRQIQTDPKADRQGQISAMGFQRYLTGCFSAEEAALVMNADLDKPIT